MTGTTTKKPKAPETAASETAAKGKAVKIKETDKAIVFKATKKLTMPEFELLSNMVKHEQEKTGIKIVLMPFSCEVGE